MNTIDSSLLDLAQRIRSERTNRGLTLDEVAKLSGFSKSWLSKVENFRISPSLSALLRLCKILECPVEKLFERVEQDPISIVRSGERQEIERDPSPDNPSFYTSLAFKAPNRVIEPLILNLAPYAARKDKRSHDGDEFIYILKGCGHLEFGDQTHELNEGDCAYFDGAIPHRLVNQSDTPLEAMCVFCPLGTSEGDHEQAPAHATFATNRVRK